MEKTAVFAPIPSATMMTAAAVKPRFFASRRAPNRKSRITVSRRLPARTSRTRSFTCSTPPLYKRGPAGLDGAHPRLHFLAGGQVDVGAKLGVEIGLEPRAPSEIAPGSGQPL